MSALHSSTIVGKLESGKKETIELYNFLRAKWYFIKPVMPIASGGLHPGLIPQLVEYFGNDLIINCGGGLWGHPLGIEAGAKAIRQAIDATTKKIQLRKYAEEHEELNAAIKKWGTLS